MFERIIHLCFHCSWVTSVGVSLYCTRMACLFFSPVAPIQKKGDSFSPWPDYYAAGRLKIQCWVFSVKTYLVFQRPGRISGSSLWVQLSFNTFTLFHIVYYLSSPAGCELSKKEWLFPVIHGDAFYLADWAFCSPELLLWSRWTWSHTRPWVIVWMSCEIIPHEWTLEKKSFMWKRSPPLIPLMG